MNRSPNRLLPILGLVGLVSIGAVLEAQLPPGATARLRKRVAVMPVKVGALSAEIGLPGEVVAAQVRDALEAEMAYAPGLVVVNRAELGDVVAEQQMAAGSLFNAELAPVVRRLIPAQFLIYVTVGQADLTVQRQTASQSEAGAKLRRAIEVEEAASRAQARALADSQRLSSRVTEPPPLPSARDCGALWNCAQYSDPAALRWCDTMRQQCEREDQMQRQMAEQDHRNSIRSAQSEILQQQQRAQEQRARAQAIRRQAGLATTQTSQQEVRSSQLSLIWKALETSTGAVLASGTIYESAQLRRRSQSQSSSFSSSSRSLARNRSAVFNLALAKGISQVAQDVDRRLAEEPFRAKVVRVDGETVIFNAGSSLGVTVGDAFGLRDKREVLTDPDTGLPLTAPGPPIGLLRVYETAEKVAFARIERRVGEIERGDELEWLANVGH